MHSPLLRIANPQSLNRLGHFLTPDSKSGGTPNGKIKDRSKICPTHPEPTVTAEGKGKGKKLLAQGVWGKQGESSGKICVICEKSYS